MKTTSLILACTIAIAGSQVFAKSSTPKVSKDKAQAAALQAVPGELVGWSLAAEDDGPVYSFDIKLPDGRVKEIEIDGTTGKKNEEAIELEVHGNGVDRKSTNAADLAKLTGAKVSKDKAEATALKAYSGKVDQWEAELENGHVQYEFLISGKAGKKIIEVSGKTGTITETSRFVDGTAI